MIDGRTEFTLYPAELPGSPVGLELMHETQDTATYLGDLACLGKTETEHHDDFMTLSKPSDPHLGVDLELDSDFGDILSIA